jgi:hypothetical protein
MDALTIERTVDVPADHRLFIEVPPEIPAGRTILTLTLTPADGETAPRRRLTDRQRAAIEKCRGLAKKMGSRLTSDDFLEQRRKDRELEDRLDALQREGTQ